MRSHHHILASMKGLILLWVSQLKNQNRSQIVNHNHCQDLSYNLNHICQGKLLIRFWQYLIIVTITIAYKLQIRQVLQSLWFQKQLLFHCFFLFQSLRINLNQKMKEVIRGHSCYYFHYYNDRIWFFSLNQLHYFDFLPSFYSFQNPCLQILQLINYLL